MNHDMETNRSGGTDPKALGAKGDRGRAPYAKAVLRATYRKGELRSLGRLRSVAGSDPRLDNTLPGLPPVV